jgi:8-oxo-dGTP diphosphatase
MNTNRLPDPSPPKHIVAVSGLVTNAEGRILMIRGPRRGWEFPGGQVEEGENLLQALKREILEETGIEVEVGKLAGVYSNVASHIVAFGFLCEWRSGVPRTSPESLAVEWVARDEALGRITHPAIHERMRDMLEFDGPVAYRAYSYKVTEERTEYIVHDDHVI